MRSHPRWILPVAVIAVLFGAASILSGGWALFGGADARAAVGNAVLFVLWFNFLAGFVYILGGVTLYAGSPRATPIAWLIGLSTLAVFGILIVLAISGTPFEWRTIGALVIRSGFWLAIAAALTAYSSYES